MIVADHRWLAHLIGIGAPARRERSGRCGVDSLTHVAVAAGVAAAPPARPIPSTTQRELCGLHEYRGETAGGEVGAEAATSNRLVHIAKPLRSKYATRTRSHRL
jgi:hypothetical protein